MVNSFLAGSRFTVTTGLKGNKTVQAVKIAVVICAATVTNDYTKTYLDLEQQCNIQKAELTAI